MKLASVKLFGAASLRSGACMDSEPRQAQHLQGMKAADVARHAAQNAGAEVPLRSRRDASQRGRN